MSTIDRRTASTFVTDRARTQQDLVHYLRPTHFPARVDQLLSTLARHRAPSRLYWQLASLPLSSTYASLPELLDAIEGHTPRSEHPEPI